MRDVQIHIQRADGTWEEVPQETQEELLARRRREREAARKAKEEERRLKALPPEILFLAPLRNGWLKCTRGHYYYDTKQFVYWRDGVETTITAERAYKMLDRVYPAAVEGELLTHRTVVGYLKTKIVDRDKILG